MISEGALLALHTSGARRVIAAAEPAALEEPPVDATGLHHATKRVTLPQRLETTHRAQVERNGGRLSCLFVCQNCTEGGCLVFNEGAGKCGQPCNFLTSSVNVVKNDARRSFAHQSQLVGLNLDI